MDQPPEQWLSDEVCNQIKRLQKARNSFFKNSGQIQDSQGDIITSTNSIGPGGELSYPRCRISNYLQIQKVFATLLKVYHLQIYTNLQLQWIKKPCVESPPNSGLQPQAITANLCDKTACIKCEFTPACVEEFEKIQKRHITEYSTGAIVQLLEYNLVLQGSNGALFWKNFRFDDNSNRHVTRLAKKVSKSNVSGKASPPEPIYLVHKVRVISSNIPLCKGKRRAVKHTPELKVILQNIPRKGSNDKRESAGDVKRRNKTPTTQVDSDSESKDFKSQTKLLEKKKKEHYGGTLSDSFGDISQIPFATQGVSQYSPSPESDASEKKSTIKCLRTTGSRRAKVKRHESSSSEVLQDAVHKTTHDHDEGLSKDPPSIVTHPSEHGKHAKSLRSGEGQNRSKEESVSRKLARPRKAMELPLHPGWQGMTEVTALDVTIPAKQLAILETDEGIFYSYISPCFISLY